MLKKMKMIKLKTKMNLNKYQAHTWFILKITMNINQQVQQFTQGLPTLVTTILTLKSKRNLQNRNSGLSSMTFGSESLIRATWRMNVLVEKRLTTLGPGRKTQLRSREMLILQCISENQMKCPQIVMRKLKKLLSKKAIVLDRPS